MTEVLIFVLGSIIGSFLNVCIYRLPRDKSVVFPSSFCVSCKKPIKFYDNIPILSYVLLRGRCRECGDRISVRYPVVELVTACLFLLAYKKAGVSMELFIFWLFISVLIVISFIDLEFQIIPDILSIGGIVAGLAVSFLRPHFTFMEAFLGTLVGGGILFVIAKGYELSQSLKSPYFRSKEFSDRDLKEENLWDAIEKDHYGTAAPVSGDALDRLNKFLEDPSFYGMWYEKCSTDVREYFVKAHRRLIGKSKDYRSEGFENLSSLQQKHVLKLNRLMLQATYPETCPDREGMGYGDVKLLAMVGSLCGAKGAVFTLIAACVSGSMVGIPLMIAKGKGTKYAIPFGPFLSLGALVYLFFGDAIVNGYVNLLVHR